MKKLDLQVIFKISKKNFRSRWLRKKRLKNVNFLFFEMLFIEKEPKIDTFVKKLKCIKTRQTSPNAMLEK